MATWPLVPPISITVILVSTALTSFVGCNLIPAQRKSQLDGVRHAALKIESRIATGVNRIEYPQILSELAYELLLAKDLTLDVWDSEAAKKYEEALQTYLAAKEVWEANQQYQDCLKEFRNDEKFCRTIHNSSVQSAAAKARVSADVVLGANAVQVVWQVAQQQVEAAETIRQGRLPPTSSKETHKN